LIISPWKRSDAIHVCNAAWILRVGEDEYLREEKGVKLGFDLKFKLSDKSSSLYRTYYLFI